jgi:hypothetical protein
VPEEPVRLWGNFLAEAFNTSSSLDASNRRFNRPNFFNEFLSVEDSVVDAFLDTMKSINNQRLILLPRPECWGKSYFFGKVKGQPDAIRCSADDEQLLKRRKASQILAIVEVKPDQLMSTLLEDGLNLHEAYNRAVTIIDDGTTAFTKNQRLIKIVRQTFGYMVVNDLRYGLLTTYVRTWFFCRDCKNPNIIYISPEVYLDQNHTSTQPSFLECMYYHETLSTRDRTADDDDDGNNKKDDKFESSSKKENSKRKNSKRKNSKRKWGTLKVITRIMARKMRDDNKSENLEDMKNYERSQFSFGDVLGNGRSGVVFAVKLCGEVGALKMVELYKNEYLLKEILNEINIYLGPLMDIQDIYIPKLLKFGILHEAFVFALTSLSGKSFAELDDITEREKQLAIEGLQAIHARGVMHGDVRMENIMVDRSESICKSRVRWIDFAWSKTGRDSKDFNRELIELRSLLSMTGSMLYVWIKISF